MKKVIIIAIICLSLLSNCNANQENTKELEKTISPHDSITISSEKFGAVKGTIQTEVDSDRVGLILYLGDVISDSNGMFGGFLNPEIAPVAKFDSASGDFAFIDVKPGEYAIIIHEVVLGGQAYVDESGNVVIISVEEGQITDLGKISFEGF